MGYSGRKGKDQHALKVAREYFNDRNLNLKLIADKVRFLSQFCSAT